LLTTHAYVYAQVRPRPGATGPVSGTVPSAGRCSRTSVGEPGPRRGTLPVAAPAVITCASRAGPASARPDRHGAATPVTCGDAIDVPEYADFAEPSARGAEVTRHRGRTGPGGAVVGDAVAWREKGARASLRPVAPAEMARHTLAREKRVAGSASLPTAAVSAQPSRTAPWVGLTRAPIFSVMCAPAVDAAPVPPFGVTGRLPLAEPGSPAGRRVRVRAVASRPPPPPGRTGVSAGPPPGGPSCGPKPLKTAQGCGIGHFGQAGVRVTLRRSGRGGPGVGHDAAG